MNGQTALVWSERPDVIPELIAACRDAAHVVAVAFGAGPAAADWLARGADRVWIVPVVVADAAQRAAVLEQLLAAAHASLVLTAATRTGIETMAHLAQRAGVSCVHGCLSVVLEADAVLATRSRFGRFVATERLPYAPALLTIPPRRFTPLPTDASRRGEICEVAVNVPPSSVRVLARRTRAPSAADIVAARRVVSVGRGLRVQSDLALIEALARALRAAVGASRPIADHLQWLPGDVKVGLSGKTVRPDLYVACGISGQCEHVVGMRESRVVVAVNADPDAPIHAEADYAVVADLYEFLPAWIAALGATPGPDAAASPDPEP